MRVSKVYVPSDEDFKKIVMNSNSYSDCLRTLGLGTRGGTSSKTLKRRIAELQCSTEHFLKQTEAATDKIRIPLEEILKEGSTYQNIARLKLRLVSENKMDYSCSLCGIDEWLDNPISLQLDHINGISNDHRIENLRFLCPNCHSQTETYAGKNKK